MCSATWEFSRTGVTELTCTIQHARNVLRFPGSEKEVQLARVEGGECRDSTEPQLVERAHNHGPNA